MGLYSIKYLRRIKMTIKEVEERLNITRANVRFYEKEGLLIADRNPLNGYRDYSEENISTLKKIIFLRGLDITLENIRALQNRQVTLDELLEQQAVLLKEKSDSYAASCRLCTEMVKEHPLSYDDLSVEKYNETPRVSDYALIKDTFNRIPGLGMQLLFWTLIVLSVISAAVTWPLLPFMIPLEGNSLFTVSSLEKYVLFLFPAAAVLLHFLMKPLAYGILCRQAPVFLRYTDILAGYGGICSAVMLFSCQLYTIFYNQGLPLNIGMVLLTEAVCFIFVSMFSLILKQCPPRFLKIRPIRTSRKLNVHDGSAPHDRV